MIRYISTGKCTFCNAAFSKGAMSKHLISCKQRKVASETSARTPGSPKMRGFHLVAEGRRLPEYWMHLAVPAKATLADMDSFLRDIWLECCEHLSAFAIEGRRYSSSPMKEYGDRGMKVAMGDVLSPGLKFYHEYDFGSTTELVLRVLSELESESTGNSIQIMARNEPPAILCGSCKKTATKVCTVCTGEEWLCDGCARRHKCAKEMLLPVVNSPRVGVCGYSG